MKIGLDVDGVLTNLEEYQLKYGKKYFKNVKDIDETGYDICDIFHCTRDEREKFWTKHIWKYCLQPMNEDAVAAVARLKAEGHEVHIITGRAHTTEDNFVGKIFRKMLLWRLKKDHIPYDSITFCSEAESAVDKAKICDELGIDVLIDDKKENIEILDGKVDIICFDALYNRNISTNNYVRVSNFNEAYEELEKIARRIKKIKKEDTFQVLNLEEKKNLTEAEKENYYKELRDFYKKLPYDHSKIKRQERRYVLISNLGIPILKFFLKPNIFNGEKLKCDSGVIYVANHNNYYDQFPIITAIGTKPIHFLTATKMLNMKRGFFYKLTGAVSIDRESKSDRKRATEDVEKILIHGGTVFIFPEGRTNREKVKLLPFQLGAVSIAQNTGKPIIPIAVTDNYKRGEVCVRAGDKFFVSATDDVVEKTEELQKNVEYLIDENEKFNIEKSTQKVKSRKKI